MTYDLPTQLALWGGVHRRGCGDGCLSPGHLQEEAPGGPGGGRGGRRGSQRLLRPERDCSPSQVGFREVSPPGASLLPSCTAGHGAPPVTLCRGKRRVSSFVLPKAAPFASSPRALQSWTPPSSGWPQSPGSESAPGSRGRAWKRGTLPAKGVEAGVGKILLGAGWSSHRVWLTGHLPADAPQLMELPRDVTVELGRSALLACRATGRPPPRVTWRRRDGRPLGPGQGSRTGQPDSGVLSFESKRWG